MTSSVPQSATLPLPLRSPHSPYSKNRVSAFGSCFDDYEEVCNRRAQQQQQQNQQQSRFCIRSDAERTDTETSSITRWSGHSSQPTTPCTESNPSALVRGVKSNTSTPALGTPPSLATSKDARLACRQSMEEAYAPATTETSGDSGRPQKKELRIEECTANVCTVNRAIFSPATTVSMDTACTGGRDSSFFSFVSSVPDAYLAVLPVGRNVCNDVCCLDGRHSAPTSATLASPTLAQQQQQQHNQTASPTLSISIPAPPHGGTIATVVEHSPTERSTAGATTAASETSASSSRISKCKRRLQGLNRPAFDLKAVEDAQNSFLEEEEVCNAAQCFPLSEITPLLCVGTWKDAANPVLLRRLGIKYVLNVARELDPAAEASVIAHNKDLIYESIPMSDCHSQDVGAHLRQAFQFIERARAAKSRVLVHCRRGISRSPAIVVGYLMASEHRSYEEALRFVTERRSCVSLNLAFQERLSDYVPSAEFYHGPPSLPRSSTAAATPGSTLPSLPSTSSRSEQGGNTTNSNSGGGGACMTSHGGASTLEEKHQSQQRLLLGSASFHKSDDPLPPPHGPFSTSTSTSNASSRASSNMRQNLSLTGVPSTTPNLGRPAPHRPRLIMHRKIHKENSASSTTTPGANSKWSSASSNTSTATPSTTGDRSVSAAGAMNGIRLNNNRASWLEEDIDAPASAPALATSHKSHFGSPYLSIESATWSEKTQMKTPLRVQATMLTMQTPCGDRRCFADFGNGSAFNNEDIESHSSTCSSSSSVAGTNPEEGKIEEPGSPFGVCNHRAFVHFNFSQPRSSSINVSSGPKKNASSFSGEAADHSTTLPHSSESPRPQQQKECEGTMRKDGQHDDNDVGGFKQQQHQHRSKPS